MKFAKIRKARDSATSLSSSAAMIGKRKDFFRQAVPYREARKAPAGQKLYNCHSNWAKIEVFGNGHTGYLSRKQFEKNLKFLAIFDMRFLIIIAIWLSYLYPHCHFLCQIAEKFPLVHLEGACCNIFVCENRNTRSAIRVSGA